MTNRDVVALLLDAPRQALVAGPPGRGSARATTGAMRWTARKLAALGWRPQTTFEDGLAATVDWFRGQRGLVAGRPIRRLGRLLRAPVRRAARRRQPRPSAATDRHLMRVAVTGASGRLGRALVAALADAPFTGPRGPIAWTRADVRPRRAGRRRPTRLDRDRPEVVVHAAAWTDVDGCARDPELAHAPQRRSRPGSSPRRARRGAIDLLVDLDERGVRRRSRRRPRVRARRPAARPATPTARSKLDRRAARDRGLRASRPGGRLGIVRTAWLFGPPGRDFPRKILEAAERAAAAGEPLRVVDDEWGTPTYAADVAEAIVELLADDAHRRDPPPRQRRVASRADWAEDVLARLGRDVAVEQVPATAWERASRAAALGRAGADAAPVVASRCGRGPRRWPTTRRSSRATAAPGRDDAR